MPSKEILQAGRDKLTPFENWTQGVEGTIIHDGGSCIYLAIANDWSKVSAIVFATLGVTSTEEVWKWNDTHTHTEVLAALDTAIANA